MPQEPEVLRLVQAYQDIWFSHFPALSRRAEWHIAHHLCMRGRNGAPVGELYGLAKQIFLKPERKFSRKLREVLLAVEIERNFSKQEILQFYLNQVYFGEGAYGAQAAARNYFGKEISDLSLAEDGIARLFADGGMYLPDGEGIQYLQLRLL